MSDERFFSIKNIEAYYKQNYKDEIEVCIEGRDGEFAYSFLTPADAINLGNFLIKIGRRIMEEKE